MKKVEEVENEEEELKGKKVEKKKNEEKYPN